jgi:ribosomal protein S18 acetylase RimI-like enzyme
MLTIRLATADDVALLAELGTSTYREHFSSFWTPAGLERFLTEDFDESKLRKELDGSSDVRYALCFLGDQPIGFAKMRRDSPIPPAHTLRGLKLIKLYFAKAATGQGYGSSLLAYVGTLARDLGAARVWLDVLKSNVSAARFYERHGFVRHAELPFTTDKAEIGRWVMIRDVTD